MPDALVTSTSGLLFVLAANAALWFWLERRTGWTLFEYVPPLIFIYVLPAVFSNTGLITHEAAVYDWMGDVLLPFFLVLLLLDVDVPATVRVMGRGVAVMLVGTAGVVIGAPLAFLAAWLCSAVA